MSRWAELALAAGATQLGEAGTLHFILNEEELARFVALVAGEPSVGRLPPLPY